MITYGYAACPKQELCPLYRYRKTEQVGLLKKRSAWIVFIPLIYYYTYDIPLFVSKKYAYADDLRYCILRTIGRAWRRSQAKTGLHFSEYLQTWRITISHSKTVTAALHLNNREAKRKLTVYISNDLLLDRSPTFYHHIEILRKNWNRVSHC